MLHGVWKNINRRAPSAPNIYGAELRLIWSMKGWLEIEQMRQARNTGSNNFPVKQKNFLLLKKFLLDDKEMFAA